MKFAAAIAVVTLAAVAPAAAAGPGFLTLPFRQESGGRRSDEAWKWLGDGIAMWFAECACAEAIESGEIGRAPETGEASVATRSDGDFSLAAAVKMAKERQANAVLFGSFAWESGKLRLTPMLLADQARKMVPLTAREGSPAELAVMLGALEKEALASFPGARRPRGAQLWGSLNFEAFAIFVQARRPDATLAERELLLARALRESPEAPLPHAERLFVLAEMKAPGKLAAALAALPAAALGVPQVAHARAIALYEIGEYEAARKAFAALLSAGPSARVANNLGVTLAQLGFFEEARQTLRRASPPRQPGAPDYDDHDDYDLLYNQGVVEFMDGRFESSQRFFTAAAKLSADPSGARRLASILGSSDVAAIKRVRELAGKLLRLESRLCGRSSVAPSASAAAMATAGRHHDSGPGAVGPSDEEPMRQKGAAMMASGNLREAQDLLTQLVIAYPHSAANHLLLAQLYERQTAWESAIREASVALWKESSEPALLLLARAHTALGHFAEARTCAEKALQLNPSSEEARSILVGAGSKPALSKD